VCVAWLKPVNACAQGSIGVDALYLNGTHTESNGSVHDAFVAPDFRFAAGGERLQFQAEGIPTFGITSSPTNPTLPATTAFGFVDGTVLYAVDRQSRYWLGVGGLVINQQTQLPPSSNAYQYETESSRVAGARYEAQVQLPVKQNAVIIQFADMPGLHGTLYLSNCKYCHPSDFNVAEQGAMTDASVLFEMHRSRSMWALGARFINYSAIYTENQGLADRDVGLGLIVRYAYAFGH
jgi:hypothetical protein